MMPLPSRVLCVAKRADPAPWHCVGGDGTCQRMPHPQGSMCCFSGALVYPTQPEIQQVATAASTAACAICFCHTIWPGEPALPEKLAAGCPLRRDKPWPQPIFHHPLRKVCLCSFHSPRTSLSATCTSTLFLAHWTEPQSCCVLALPAAGFGICSFLIPDNNVALISCLLTTKRKGKVRCAELGWISHMPQCSKEWSKHICIRPFLT